MAGNDNTTVFRMEKKFLIPMEYLYRQRDFLLSLMREDPHNGAEGYLIRSLYFDTPHSKDYQDKVDGAEIRKKIRLRIYAPGAQTALLEMKQKQGDHQRKRSLPLPREDAMRLRQGDYAPLLAVRDSFGPECYALMASQLYRPASIVEYRRFAFILQENNTRVTFDYNITATESSTELFSPSLPMYPVLDAGLAVLEVKYNGFLLSPVKSFMENCRRSTVSVSKYGLSRGISRHFVL